MFKTIVVPSDLEGSSRPGLSMAADLARQSGGKLVIVHVLSSGSIDVADVPHEAKPLREQAEQRARTLLEDEVSRLGDDIDHEIQLTYGNPSEEVTKLVKLADADLVVITVKNRSRIGKLLMGSQAQEIILASHCPVLCVPKS